MRKSLLATGSVIAILASTALAGSTAFATPGSGTTATAVSGTLDGPSRVKADGVKLQIREDATVRSINLTYAVGGFSGWHEHPGIVIAVVKSGTVSRQLPCGDPESFTVGQSFTEVGPHYVRNEGSTPAELIITAIFPADTDEEFRQDLPEPVCKK